MSISMTMPQFPGGLRRAYWLLSLLWIAGWVISFVVGFSGSGTGSPSIDSYGLLALFAFLPPAGVYAFALVIYFLIENRILLPLILSASGLCHVVGGLAVP